MFLPLSGLSITQRVHASQHALTPLVGTWRFDKYGDSISPKSRYLLQIWWYRCKHL